MNHKEERIQKLVSNYGNFSRREFEKLIKEGKVYKNGEKVFLGEKATINDKITVNSKVIKFNLKRDYYLVNKPKGYISKRVDDQQREVISLIPDSKNKNLFSVGRLDVLTSGLIIVTNDGYLSNLINKPNSKIKKTYLIFSTRLSKDGIKQLINGITLDDGYITKKIANFKVIKDNSKLSTYKISIYEGKKNQIRRMWKAADSKVINLKRIEIGSLTLDGIELGRFKKIKQQEIYKKLGLVKKEGDIKKRRNEKI